MNYDTSSIQISGGEFCGINAEDRVGTVIAMYSSALRSSIGK